MTKKEELEYVRGGLKAYARLERKAIDEVGWIMFKLSCDRSKAARLIARVRAEDPSSGSLA